MAVISTTFASSSQWDLDHPWGTINPYVGVADTTGLGYLVSPQYTNGHVTVTFATPTAGVLTLIGPDDDDGSISLPAPSASLARQPFENAVLVEVRAPGAPDKSGDVDTPGTTMWVGQAGGYLTRPRKTVLTAGQQIDIKQDILYLPVRPGVPTQCGPGAQWNGATVVIDDLRGTTAVRKRFTVKNEDLRAIGSYVDSLRLELSHETNVV